MEKRENWKGGRRLLDVIRWFENSSNLELRCLWREFCRGGWASRADRVSAECPPAPGLEVAAALGSGAAEWEHSLLWLREWVRGTDKHTRAALEMTALLAEHWELSEAHPDDFPDKAEAAGAGSSSPYRAVRGGSRSSSYIMHSDASVCDSWIPPTPCPSG